MLPLWLTLAAQAADVVVPVQGTLAGPDGAPLDGVRSLRFLVEGGASGGVIHDEVVTVLVDRGAFSVVLGAALTPLVSEDIDDGALTLAVAVDGGLPSTPAPVGWAFRAAYAAHAGSAEEAAHAASADHATSADSATTAGHATSADSATTAGHATSADSATTAGSATSATTAATATNATQLGGQPASAWTLETELFPTFPWNRVTTGTLPWGLVDGATLPSHLAGPVEAGTGLQLTGRRLDVLASYVQAQSGGLAANGSSSTQFGYSCEAILKENPWSTTGAYWIRPTTSGAAWRAWCDMDLEGGGWLDVVKTFHLSGADATALGAFFFMREYNDSNSNFAVSAATNSSSVQGVLLRQFDDEHQAGFYLNPVGLRFTSAITSWRMQGGNDGNRCASGNWIPLSGAGYDGGHNSYLIDCPPGYSCTQGRPTEGRDAPISVTDYRQDNLTNTSQLLGWSGSASGNVSDGCARDAAIPSTEPATFFTKLLLR